MVPHVMRIERKSDPRGDELPLETSKGFKMADPIARKETIYANHAIYVETLDKVAESLSKGLGLWMKAEGKPEAFLTKNDLKVTFE